MKKTLLLMAILLPFATLAQTTRLPILPKEGVPIFSIDQGHIITNSMFIDTWTLEPRFDAVPYTLANPVTVSLSGAQYTVRTAQFEGRGWDQEGGDFRVIEITKGNQQVYLLKEPNGIWKLKGSKDNMAQYRVPSYSDNDYFLTVPLSNSATALIFFGYLYGSGDTTLPIIVLTDKEVKLVFNKSMFFMQKATSIPNTFSIGMQTNQYKVVNGVINEKEFRTFTIWKKDGTLWIKDN